MFIEGIADLPEVEPIPIAAEDEHAHEKEGSWNWYREIPFGTKIAIFASAILVLVCCLTLICWACCFRYGFWGWGDFSAGQAQQFCKLSFAGAQLIQ